MQFDGMIIKGYSGFYYVWDGENNWECSLRGKYRVKKQSFLIGDHVVCTIINEQQRKAVIEMVLPRKTELQRPPIANIEQAIIVTSLAAPEPDFWLLDRLLVLTQKNGINPVLCFNKVDLVSAVYQKEVQQAYDGIGFPIVFTSSVKAWGIEELHHLLRGKASVFAGPSGVGKSSLLNTVQEGLALKTGEISDKLGRGKHTTRHVELLHLEIGGFVADTPGFSQLYLPLITGEELIEYFPDILCYKNLCRFNNCLHKSEPECAVRAAVDKGLLSQSRYERYIEMLEEVLNLERRY